MAKLNNKIAFDKRYIGVLASDTRVEILEELCAGANSLKGLCDKLGLLKSTVSEHLSKPIDAGLIEQVNRSSRWVYYQLTEVRGD